MILMMDDDDDVWWWRMVMIDDDGWWWMIMDDWFLRLSHELLLGFLVGSLAFLALASFTFVHWSCNNIISNAPCTYINLPFQDNIIT